MITHAGLTYSKKPSPRRSIARAPFAEYVPMNMEMKKCFKGMAKCGDTMLRNQLGVKGNMRALISRKVSWPSATLSSLRFSSASRSLVVMMVVATVAPKRREMR